MRAFAETALEKDRPASVRASVALPRRQKYYPSPDDWRDEVLYFLLVDRFSDANEKKRPLLDRSAVAQARLDQPQPWRWDLWARSGAERWQGGTLEGVKSKLNYLKRLGVSAIWLSPIFKQRGHLDTYHGYGIQDFLQVDPRFGDRRDLVELVAAAHKLGLRIILDIIFNHSGSNWVYPGAAAKPPYKPYPDQYPFGAWRDVEGGTSDIIAGKEDGVWPAELQNQERYTRAGCGSLSNGDINDPHAEHKRSDFEDLRDLDLGAPGLLADLALCYKYWIALTDCDGFRIDTLKHVSLEEARNFCGTIKEFAANLGKHDFFLLGEIAGGDDNQDRYLDVLERNLNAALDIGGMRMTLRAVAKGLQRPADFFDGFNPGNATMGSHRNLGSRHVSVLDDHDHVVGEKIRFSSGASSDHQVAAGVALQLLSLGIPCIYYGTEQAFAGPEPSEWVWLPDWKGSDRYLREAMFGPEHPLKSGLDGIKPSLEGLDEDLPGFGPFGTSGHHCFDPKSAAFVRIAALASVRKNYPALRYGRQYRRPIAFLGYPFGEYGPGELVAWSRILDDEELLCIVNAHGTEARGADVLVDAGLNLPGRTLTVVLNTAQAASPKKYSGTHPLEQELPVRCTPEGQAYVEIREVQPSEVLVLANRPQSDVGAILL